MPANRHFNGRGCLRRRQRQSGHRVGVQNPLLIASHEETRSEQLEDRDDLSRVEEQIHKIDLISDDSGTDPEEFGEYVALQLSDLRDNFKCPICLGIIKRCRTFMGCLHRFCKDCIDKSFRLMNNECPTCRMHCASRRSMRDDTLFDSLISTIYTDIDEYEEEEMIVDQEEEVRNKQLQEVIDQISNQQSEALENFPMASSETSPMHRSRLPSNSQISNSRLSNNLSPIESKRASRSATKDAMHSDCPSTLDTFNRGSGWGSRHARSRVHSIKATLRISRLVNHLKSSRRNLEGPLTTTLARGDQVTWMKDGDNFIQILDSSSVPRSPPPGEVADWAQEISVPQILQSQEIRP